MPNKLAKPAAPPKQTPCARCPLKALPVFRAFQPNELEFVEWFKTGEFVTDAGATILMEGHSSPHLYTVLQGWAFRYKTLPDGRRQILNFAMPGDFLGLQTSMFDEMQHSVETLTKTVLCVFPREKIWALYEKFPNLAFDLTWLASRSERILDEQLLTVWTSPYLVESHILRLVVGFEGCLECGGAFVGKARMSPSWVIEAFDVKANGVAGLLA